jgi:hypothetical protein
MARAAGGHRRPWGCHPGGGHRVGAAGRRRDDAAAPLSRRAGPEAEDSVDLIGDALGCGGRRGSTAVREGGGRAGGLLWVGGGAAAMREEESRQGGWEVGTALHCTSRLNRVFLYFGRRLNRVWFRKNQLSH